MIDDKCIDALENLFLCLSDKTRLRLLGLMANEEVSVGYLADALGESQPKISRHLAYLRNAGLVDTRRDGRWIYYVASEPSDLLAAGVLRLAIGRERPVITSRTSHERPEIPQLITSEPVVDHERSLEPIYEADAEAEHFPQRDDELEIFLL